MPRYDHVLRLRIELYGINRSVSHFCRVNISVGPLRSATHLELMYLSLRLVRHRPHQLCHVSRLGPDVCMQHSPCACNRVPTKPRRSVPGGPLGVLSSSRDMVTARNRSRPRLRLLRSFESVLTSAGSLRSARASRWKSEPFRQMTTSCSGVSTTLARYRGSEPAGQHSYTGGCRSFHCRGRGMSSGGGTCWSPLDVCEDGPHGTGYGIRPAPSLD